MPQCKQCGQEFTRDRDTKSFCRATCRSLYRYHKNKGNKVTVQKDSVQKENPVVSVQEKPVKAKVSVTEEGRSKWDEAMKRYE
jgi:hypothetical protein